MKRFSMAMTWLALAGLMTTVSCRKPVVGFTNGEARTVTISAVTESGGGSKTAIEGLNVKWSKDDQIRMNAESVLTLEDECVGSTMGRFTGEVTGGGPYYIGYPADNTTCAGATVKLNIPDSWAYDADMKEIVPMVAYADDVDDDVYFRNAVNMLKLQLKGDDTDASKLTSIVLTSTTSYLSGDISVTFDEGGNPTFNAITDGAKTMTVSFGDGLQLKADEVKCVYIPLAKISVDDVLTVRFNCVKGSMEKKLTATEGFSDVNNMLSAPELMMGHETVNFGTPNLNWSKYNLGVDPDDLDAAEDWYGDYYAWGETAPYYQNGVWCEHPSHNSGITFDASVGYKWKNYLDGSSTLWDASKDWKPYGEGTTLTSEHDAATQAWGGGWRMPTYAEWDALCANNTFEWLDADAESAKVSGFKAVAAGYLVVKGGKKSVELDPSVYMFLPAAGYRNDSSLSNAGSYGYYWSSSFNSSSPDRAYYVYFHSGNVGPQDNGNRCYGLTVRPVR